MNSQTALSGEGNPNLHVFGYAGQSYTDTVTGDVWGKPEMSQPGTSGWDIISVANDNKDRFWPLNVKEEPFNAKGDGVTDDTSAIQRALDAVPDSGGEVFIPAGTYIVSAPLEIKSNSVVCGAGIASQIFLKASSNCAVITNSNYGNDQFSYGNENITLKNLRVNGNRTQQNNSTTTHNRSGINFVNVDGLLIENVDSDSCTEHGIGLGNRDNYDPTAGPGCNNYRIIGCRCKDNGDDGISPHWSTRGYIAFNYVRDSAKTWTGNSNGIEVDEGCDGALLVDNVVLNCNNGFECKGHDARDGDVATTRPSRNIVIKGMLVLNCSNYAYDIGHDGTEEWGENVTMVGCSSYNCLGHISIKKYRHVKVYGGRGVRTSSSSTNGIRLTKADQDSIGSLSCVDILFSGVTMSGYTGQTFACWIVGQGSESVTIEDCYIEKSNRGIWVGDYSSNTVVRGCTVRCDSDTTTGILVGGDNAAPIHGVKIIDCKVIPGETTGSVSYGVRISAVGNSSIDDVEVRGCLITGANRNETDMGAVTINATSGSSLNNLRLFDNDISSPQARSGIAVTGAVPPTRLQIKRNTISNHQRYGFLGTVSNAIISDNTFEGNGSQTNNTYAQIRLSAGDRNNFTNNAFRQGDNANKPSYSIQIASGTENWIDGNDLYQSGASGAIDDLGTDTHLGNNLFYVAPFPFNVPAIHAVWADDPNWANPGNNNPVSSWRDINGSDLTQATAGQRPTFIASASYANNHAAVEFNGASSTFLANNISNISQPFYVMIVARSANGANSTQEVFMGRGGGGTDRGFMKDSGNNWEVNMNTDLSTSGGVDSSLHVFLYKCNGVGSEIRVDGVLVAQGSAGGGNLAWFTLGAGDNGGTRGFYFTGGICFAGIYSGSTNIDKLVELSNSLMTYYNIPTP